MLELRTINDITALIASRGDEPVAMIMDGEGWKALTGKQMYGRVRALASKLQAWGIRRGDRVAFVGENRWEWPVSDFAIMAVGAVGVPLYQTLPPEQMALILRDSGAKALLLSNGDQYEKLLKAGEIESLEHVAVWDDGPFGNAETYESILRNASDLEKPSPEFENLLKEASADDLATLIYTSGTTGDPKGVMLTHGNLASNLRHSTDGLHIEKGDVTISYLPLSHALARHQDYAFYSIGAVIAYLPKFDDLPGAMKSVKPTLFVGVPRVYEKVREAVEGKVHGISKIIFDWSQKQGVEHLQDVAEGKEPHALGWSIANKLAFSKIREAFGGRVKVFISGGAPLGKDTTEWFLSEGIRIFEGYGLTETSPVIARNTFDGYRAGTVGKVIPNMEVRLAGDGELEVRGGSVFKGYWQNDEGTKKEFTEDNWFKTGDIANLEDDFLSITDRKKELLKTSGGKYVAPQPIESKLKSNPLVGQAALIGDNQRFVSLLISPDFQALEDWAKHNGISGSDRAELVKDERVCKVYQSTIDEVNGSLGHHETIKKFAVVPDEWTVQGDQLTPSLKLKRRKILEKYKDQIDEFYKE